MSTSTPEPNMFVRALESLANDEDSIRLGVSDHIIRLATGLDNYADGLESEEATITHQQAYLAANYETFMPAGTSPHDVLAGKHGVEAQRAFLLGAVAALDNVISANLATPRD